MSPPKSNVDTPLLSSIVLNWNRADLLRLTLESYATTIDAPHELFVVDNASSDGSRSVIKDFCRHHAGAVAILLDRNYGGLGFNPAIERCRGSYVHLSDNDIEYLPGWWETAAALFAAFPDLGELSLMGPVPTDDEVWEVHPATLVSARRRFLYRTDGNVGTNAVLRREVIDAGVRVFTYFNPEDPSSALIPADAKLSEDVRQAGWMVAWAPWYLVRNRGHEAAEFTARPDYYRTNYESKPWLGHEGWMARRASWEASAKPGRTSHLFREASLMAEMSPSGSTEPMAHLWSMFDQRTAELESVELLFALSRIIKPQLSVHLGTWRGFGVVALGLAAKQNDIGEVVAVDLDPDHVELTKTLAAEQGVTDRVSVMCAEPDSFEPPPETGLLVLSGGASVAPERFVAMVEPLRAGAFVVIEHASQDHGDLRASVAELGARNLLAILSIDSPRGLVVAQRTTVEP